MSQLTLIDGSILSQHLVITDLPKSRLLHLRPKPDVLIHFKPDKLHTLKLNVTDGTA